uniref:Uncharacterized protein n=1 Tax=Zea mays TaxID=4577 RepID=B6TN70_MAIZE|nr:hypothetical protein [Zea mays]
MVDITSRCSPSEYLPQQTLSKCQIKGTLRMIG